MRLSARDMIRWFAVGVALAALSCVRPYDPVPQLGDLSGHVWQTRSSVPVVGTVVTCAGRSFTVGSSG